MIVILSNLLKFWSDDRPCTELNTFCALNRTICNDSVYEKFSEKKRWPIVAHNRPEFLKLCALFKHINFNQQSEESIDISIKSLDGETITVSYHKNMTVNALRAYALQLTNIRTHFLYNPEFKLESVRLIFPFETIYPDSPTYNLNSFKRVAKMNPVLGPKCVYAVMKT